MGRYALQRFLLVIPTLLGMTLLIFILVRLLPGDIVTSMSAGEITSDANHQRIRTALGLNDPLPLQYVHYLGGLLTGGLLTAAYAYAPRQHRALVQAGATAAIVVLLAAAVIARNSQLAASALG